MTVRNTRTRSWANYRIRFREDTHWLFGQGYSEARHQINGNCLENHITGMIVVAINGILDAPQTPARIRKYYSVYEEEMLLDPAGVRVANARRRADIRLRHSVRAPRRIYLFEAKLLRGGTRGGSTALRAYLGTGGLHQVLTDPSYLLKVTEAAMVGYVQSRRVQDWKAEVISELNGTSKTRLQVISGPLNITVVSALPDTLISEHVNGHGEVVPILHILIDCR